MMNTIINENELTFKGLEKNIFRAVCRIAQEFTARLLEEIDEKIAESRDKTLYRNKGKRQTTIKTIYGEVVYSRNVYATEQEGSRKYVYLLDEKLKLRNNGMFSANIQEQILETVTDLSYRKTAREISERTGQSISAMGVWNLVQSYGEKACERDRQLVTANKENRLDGKIEAPVLFEEADGTYINLQGKDRKHYAKGKGEIKISTTYSGWHEVSKNRYMLKDKIVTAGFWSSKEFQLNREAAIANKYNLDETQVRVLNGDGAPWIKRVKDKDTIFQLDPFHKHQAIRTYIANKFAVRDIEHLLAAGNIEEVLRFIEMYADGLEDQDEELNARALLTYFENNKEGLLPYDKQGVPIPKAPKGVIYRHMGTMENHVRGVITRRMKHNQTSWSKRGGNNMCKLLAMKASGELDQLILDSELLLKELTVEEDAGAIMSCFKVSKKIGKGYEYPSTGHLTLLDSHIRGARYKAFKMAGFMV